MRKKKNNSNSNIHKKKIKVKGTKSIKQKTALWYTYLYLLIALIAVLVLSITILKTAYKNVYKENSKINKSMTQILQNGNFEDTEYIKRNIYNIEKTYDESVISLINTNGDYYLLDDNKNIEEYIKGLKENVLFEIFPRLSLLNKGYLVSSRDINANSQVYKLLIFYPAGPLINTLMIILPPISIVLSLGAFMILILGRMKLGKILAPINQMSRTTRKITAENLDLRLDVSEAEYELKELAKTTNEMIDSFQEAYEKQEQFVSDVSHELRTPISVISGYGNMLKRWGKKDEDILNESVDSIIFEAENMKELVNRLLFLAKYDKNSLHYNFERMNLTESLNLIIKDFSVTHPDVTILHNIQDNIFIMGDEFRIIEVVRIFIDNAIKYSNNNITLKINLQKQENNAILTIKDNGIGIKEEDLKNIFYRFYRSDKSRNKETGGMGLGLSIAKAIILDHKGKIRVRTKENVGSEFSITLPLVK
ncbi:HAMP domain-containing sensor histidine kinase [Anaerofustis sp.]|uniref:sensor histidine kinase n=1 Tax=Anaerofustis sp. TaxID=1872517 RepID=UPI0025C16D23|nr:HAMP domain-containing sensor histidine kinase [Anaerofustis sp.]